MFTILLVLVGFATIDANTELECLCQLKFWVSSTVKVPLPVGQSTQFLTGECNDAIMDCAAFCKSQGLPLMNNGILRSKTGSGVTIGTVICQDGNRVTSNIQELPSITLIASIWQCAVEISSAKAIGVEIGTLADTLCCSKNLQYCNSNV